MNVFLNFVPLKAGGGLQIGLDFIENLRSLDSDWTFFLAYTEGTPFDQLELPANINQSKAIKATPFARLRYELFEAARLVRQSRADVVYTQFGPVPYQINVPQVAGCAYSNLLYPELDFWKNEPTPKKMMRKLIDSYRWSAVARADINIFETPELCNRCIKMTGRNANQVRYVLPTVSALVSEYQRNEYVQQAISKLPAKKYITYITRYHANKNLELLVSAAKILKGRGKSHLAFITTLDINDSRVRHLFDLIKKEDVENYFINIGPIPPDGCAELYRIAAFSVLASNLESFSNNIAESWSMEVPLLVTNQPWARSICADAAYYFTHMDAVSLADSIEVLDQDTHIRTSLVAMGKKRLLDFPSSEKRFRSYLNIIQQAQAGMLDKSIEPC